MVSSCCLLILCIDIFLYLVRRQNKGSKLVLYYYKIIPFSFTFVLTLLFPLRQWCSRQLPIDTS